MSKIWLLYYKRGTGKGKRGGGEKKTIYITFFLFKKKKIIRAINPLEPRLLPTPGASLEDFSIDTGLPQRKPTPFPLSVCAWSCLLISPFFFCKIFMTSNNASVLGIGTQYLSFTSFEVVVWEVMSGWIRNRKLGWFSLFYSMFIESHEAYNFNIFIHLR